MADEAKQKNEERAKALQVSYTQATAALIERHKEEFDKDRQRILKDLGFEWAPRLTQEQKDALALAEILARNPGLAGKVAASAVSPASDAHS